MTCTVAASRAQHIPGEQVPQAQTVLDSYFVTNAMPGQLQYWELIDTLFYHVNATYTNAQAAAQSASAATAASQGAVGTLHFVLHGMQQSGTPSCVLLATNGFTNVVINAFLNGSTATVDMTNYFATPLDGNGFVEGGAIAPNSSTVFWATNWETPTTSWGTTSNYLWVNMSSGAVNPPFDAYYRFQIYQ